MFLAYTALLILFVSGVCLLTAAAEYFRRGLDRWVLYMLLGLLQLAAPAAGVVMFP